MLGLGLSINNNFQVPDVETPFYQRHLSDLNFVI